jgi:hypothetical protein
MAKPSGPESVASGLPPHAASLPGMVNLPFRSAITENAKKRVFERLEACFSAFFAHS